MLDRLSIFLPRDGDVQLAVRLKRREAEALADLYDRFGGPILAFFQRVVTNKDQVAALVEETFLTVWNRIPEFEASRLALGLWLLGVARNRALNCRGCLFDQSQLFTDVEFGRAKVLELRHLRTAWTLLDEKSRHALERAFFEAEAPDDLKAALSSLRMLAVESSRAQIGQEKGQ